MKTSTVIALTTFAGAGVTCATLGVTYPIVIWGVGFAALSHRRRAAQPTTCPLLEASLQAASTQERSGRHVGDYR